MTRFTRFALYWQQTTSYQDSQLWKYISLPNRKPNWANWQQRPQCEWAGTGSDRLLPGAWSAIHWSSEAWFGVAWSRRVRLAWRCRCTHWPSVSFLNAGSLVTRGCWRLGAHRPADSTRQTDGGEKYCSHPLPRDRRPSDFSQSRRSGRIEGTRELLFPSLPYIAVYRLHKEAVEVVRIYHAAQDWP